MKTLKDLQELESCIGIVHSSKPTKTAYWWTILFGFLTGDWNKFHIHPLQRKKYISIFGSRPVRHGISVVAESTGIVDEIFSFEEYPVEIISTGYSDVSGKKAIAYTKPVFADGDEITYQYTLLKAKTKKNGMQCDCIWQINVLKKGIDKPVQIINWEVTYLKGAYNLEYISKRNRRYMLMLLIFFFALPRLIVRAFWNRGHELAWWQILIIGLICFVPYFAVCVFNATVKWQYRLKFLESKTAV